MTALLMAASMLISIVGAIIAIWSIVSTRRMHYEDYKRRKRND